MKGEPPKPVKLRSSVGSFSDNSNAFHILKMSAGVAANTEAPTRESQHELRSKQTKMVQRSPAQSGANGSECCTSHWDPILGNGGR